MNLRKRRRSESLAPKRRVVDVSNTVLCEAYKHDKWRNLSACLLGFYSFIDKHFKPKNY